MVAGLLFVSACTVGSSSPTTIVESGIPTLKTAASFDVVGIDQAAHRLYAADRTDSGVDVFDVSTPPATYLRSITLPASPNGIAVAPDLGRVFAGMSNGSLAIIDTTTGTVIKQVPTGGKSVDLIDYSSDQHQVFASNGSEGTIASIDARAGAVTAVFQVGYALEQPRFDPADRMLYVTSPDAGAVFQLDPTTGKIKNKLPVGGCLPHGLAINPKLKQAMIACPSSIFRMNLANPSDAELFTDVTGGDIMTYDATVDRFFAAVPSTGRSSASVVGLFGGNPIAYVTSVNTGAGGNSAAYDESNGVVYTPDTRAGKAGLAGFKLPSGEPSFSVSPLAVAELAGVLAVIMLIMFVVGRLADPVRRPAPLPSRRRV